LANVPVDDNELLARFVLTDRHIPKQGTGIKAEALIPYKWVELSVSRHRDLSVAQLWTLGSDVAEDRSRKENRTVPLIGRADFFAFLARRQQLTVAPDEPPLNHAEVSDWPGEKSAQMSLAQEIAASSSFVRYA
jgi:hypothetical protein